MLLPSPVLIICDGLRAPSPFSVGLFLGLKSFLKSHLTCHRERPGVIPVTPSCNNHCSWRQIMGFLIVMEQTYTSWRSAGFLQLNKYLTSTTPCLDSLLFWFAKNSLSFLLEWSNSTKQNLVPVFSTVHCRNPPNLQNGWGDTRFVCPGPAQPPDTLKLDFFPYTEDISVKRTDNMAQDLFSGSEGKWHSCSHSYSQFSPLSKHCGLIHTAYCNKSQNIPELCLEQNPFQQLW